MKIKLLLAGLALSLFIFSATWPQNLQVAKEQQLAIGELKGFCEAAKKYGAHIENNIERNTQLLRSYGSPYFAAEFKKLANEMISQTKKIAETNILLLESALNEASPLTREQVIKKAERELFFASELHRALTYIDEFLTIFLVAGDEESLKKFIRELQKSFYQNTPTM